MSFSKKSKNILILLSSSSLLYYFYQNKINNLFSIFSYENQSATLNNKSRYRSRYRSSNADNSNVFINLNTSDYFSDSIEESNTYLNNINKLKNLDRKSNNINKKSNNILINKLKNIKNNANIHTNKTDFIMIKSLELLLNQNLYDKINIEELDDTIKLFIENNKFNCIDKTSYNNIVSGEILNYLASL